MGLFFLFDTPFVNKKIFDIFRKFLDDESCLLSNIFLGDTYEIKVCY